MNITAIELLRLLADIARAPDASPEDRARSAAELARHMERHGFTEADLEEPPEESPDWRALDPAPATRAERLLAIHLACAVRRKTAVEARAGDGEMELEATPEQWLELEALWTRHLPVFRRCWEQSAAGHEQCALREIGKIHQEREELQKRMDRLQRELECVEEGLEELPGHTLRAFVLTWNLPVGEIEDPNDPWDDDEPVPEWLVPASVIARAMTAGSGESPSAN